jgi:predicted transcriptional regulator
MEKFERAPQEPQSTEEAVSRFLDGDNNAAVSFLRNHRDEIGDFCLQVRDTYQEHDTATPFLKLAELIDSLL